MHANVRLETKLEGTLKIIIYDILILQMRKLEFKERKSLASITEL